jgi:hypothetical protein
MIRRIKSSEIQKGGLYVRVVKGSIKCPPPQYVVFSVQSFVASDIVEAYIYESNWSFYGGDKMQDKHGMLTILDEPYKQIRLIYYEITGDDTLFYLLGKPLSKKVLKGEV